MGFKRYEDQQKDNQNELRHSYTRIEHSRRAPHKPPKKDRENGKEKKAMEGQE